MAEDTAMDCLKGYVGVTAACGTTEPDSGLYVTDLPGITLQNIEAIANAEQKNFLGVWADVEKRALIKYRSAALMELNKRFQICDVTIIDCLLCDNLELLGISLQYMLGAELCYERIYSDSLNRFTTIDRGKARELREDFLIDFQTELKNAMRGIDVENSDCIEGKHVEDGGDVRWVESPL